MCRATVHPGEVSGFAIGEGQLERGGARKLGPFLSHWAVFLSYRFTLSCLQCQADQGLGDRKRPGERGSGKPFEFGVFNLFQELGRVSVIGDDYCLQNIGD